MSIFRKLLGRGDQGGSDGGEPPEFKALVADSMERLRGQTALHQSTWQFGEEERWDFSQETGALVFAFAEVQMSKRS